MSELARSPAMQDAIGRLECAPGSLAAYEALAKALDAFHAIDAERDRTIAVLTAAAYLADPRSLVAPSTVAWAEQRVKTFRSQNNCGAPSLRPPVEPGASTISPRSAA